MDKQEQPPLIDIYLSHSDPLWREVGVDENVKWYVVTPDGAEIEGRVQDLVDTGRTVYHLRVRPQLAHAIQHNFARQIAHNGEIVKLRRESRRPKHD